MSHRLTSSAEEIMTYGRSRLFNELISSMPKYTGIFSDDVSDTSRHSPELNTLDPIAQQELDRLREWSRHLSQGIYTLDDFLGHKEAVERRARVLYPTRELPEYASTTRELVSLNIVEQELRENPHDQEAILRRFWEGKNRNQEIRSLSTEAHHDRLHNRMTRSRRPPRRYDAEGSDSELLSFRFDDETQTPESPHTNVGRSGYGTIG